MGHASRCVPIIEELIQKNTVVIGVTKKNDFFFRNYFPELKVVYLPSYNIVYSKVLPLWLKLFFQWPAINSVIKREKLELQKLIEHYRFDMVISDNRFGLNSKKTKSVFVTHQLKLKTPLFTWFANALNRSYIHQFDEVWVPDYNEKEKRLSGDLCDASAIKIPVKYIGPKSATSSSACTFNDSEHYEYLFLLSGPEPQRSILEELVFKKVENISGNVAIVRGTTAERKISSARADVFDFVTGQELKQLILDSKTIVCRSGYSTLMDLHLLGKSDLILVPTPGQTEQEYLADLWQRNFGARTVRQKDFDKKF